MVGVFLRLKLSLLGSAFRRWQTAVPVLLGIVYAIPGSLAVALLLTTTGRSGVLGPRPALILIGALLTLAWTVGPVLGGVDTTVDPDALVLLPLGRADRVRGLLAAGAVGVPSVATVFVLLGAAAGFVPAGPAAVPFVLAAATTWITCLLIARTATTLLSAAAGGRRSRDLLATVGFVGILALSQVPNVARTAGFDRAGGVARPVARALGLLPWGWAGSAMAAAAEGQLVSSFAWLAAALGFGAVCALAWIRVLDRLVERGPAQVRSRVRGTGALTGPLRALRPGPVRALLAKDLRYLAAEPALRLALISQVFFAVVILFSVGAALPPGGATWLVAAIAPLGALFVVSLFGADRAASWTLLATGVDWRPVVVAKIVATAVWALPVQVLLTLATAATGDSWSVVGPALLLGTGILATALGGAAVAALLVPVPLPTPRPGAGLFAMRTGGAAGASLTQSLATLLALVPAVVPAAAALIVGIDGDRTALTLTCLGALAYGAVLLMLGIRLATRRGRARGPEIVAALTRA